MPDPTPIHWTRWLWVSLAVVVADRLTKMWMSSAFAYGEVREITPFFNLVLVHNTGAAFSFLADAGGWQRWFFTVVAVAISAAIVVMLRRHRGGALLALALALVLGGALGNMCDRVFRSPGFLRGEVVDFVSVGRFPTFNVADSAITIGAILLIVCVWLRPEPRPG